MSFTIVTDLTFDTNILFYSFDPIDPGKQEIAVRLIDFCFHRNAKVALQVLNEFYRSITLKRVSPEQATVLINDLRSKLRVEPPSEADLLTAMQLHQQSRFQFFDCMIVATFSRAGCRTFLTEDMQHGRTITGLKIINPFLLTPAELDSLLA